LILDTNAISALADGEVGLEPILQQARTIALPVIALGEYQYGIRGSRHQERYQKWLEVFKGNCLVLEVDVETCGYYALVREELKRSGRPIPANDLWIAALTRQYRLPLVSRDKHFDAVSELRRVSW
jgi:tRNA(fMet)-specific endonuclease VapC